MGIYGTKHLGMGVARTWGLHGQWLGIYGAEVLGFLRDVTGVYGAVGLQFMGLLLYGAVGLEFMEPNFEDYVANDLEMMRTGILSFSRAKGLG